MEPFDDFEDDTTGTTFRDVILLALIGFVAMVVMLLPHIHKAKTDAEDYKPPGNVIFEIHWPNELTYDVDLWVKAPNESPVGFWNQGNNVLNLLRDDLGAENDASNRNYEMIFSRGIPEGEYIVNVHMYGELPPGVEVPVKAVVAVREKYGSTSQLLQTTVMLRYQNQEETAYRFRLTSEGQLVKGSVSTLRRNLITRPGAGDVK
jgi:hypothetical protein